MIMTNRDKTREVRKRMVLTNFSDNQVLYTNEVAKKVDIVWPVADRILQELVEEGKLMGDKVHGYRLPKFWEKIRRTLHA